MAQFNDFGDIQESFDYITNALDSMRAQNAMNSGNMDKVLSNINNQLDRLANEENTDMMKVFLVELKRSLDEGHNFVSSKFGEIEDSFKEIIQKTEKQLTASEIKELFEIIATNLSVFSKDFSASKDVINEIGLTVEEIKKDESAKKEILKNISILKLETEKFGHGFESIILNLNDNFRELSQALTRLDTTEPMESLKKDIENIFLSSNAILSTMQVIDRKNRELEEIINTFVTKEDFKVEREQVAKLIAQNMQLTEYINNLPTHIQFESLTEKIDTSIGVINALKNMLGETGKQNQQMLTAQLDNLEAKILNISTEDEFIGFRKELSEFAQGVIQSTNLMRADLADTNSSLTNLYDFLNTMDIKNSFMNFAQISKTSEGNIRETVSKATEKVAEEIQKNKNLTKTDIEKGVLEVNANLESTKNAITENSKLNLSNIVENIQSVVNNIFSVKNALHIENVENLEVMDSKLHDLKEDVVNSSNFVVQNAQENVENVLSNVEKVFKEIIAVKDNLGDATTKTSQAATSRFEEIARNIEEIKKELSLNSQEGFANLMTLIDDFSQEMMSVKASLEKDYQDNAGEIKETIGGLSLKLNTLQESLTKDSEANFMGVRSSMDTLFQITQSASTSLEQNSNGRFSEIKAKFENISKQIRVVEENLDIRSQSNLERVIALFEDLSTAVENNKNFLSESNQVNYESVSLHIQNLSQKLEESKVDFSNGLKSSFLQVQDAILNLPETIKNNQVVFENENKFLIEETSKSVKEADERIQNLIRSVAAKENPFKEEVIYEISELKSSLEVIKESLGTPDSEISENVGAQITDCIENIEEIINQYSEKYNVALYNLQNKISDYFQSIQKVSSESDLKLNTSLQEASDIKAEVQGLAQKLAVMSEDTSIKDLSVEIKQKFDGIVYDLSKLEEKISSESAEKLQNILNSVEEKFDTVSSDLTSYKNCTSNMVNSFVEELAEKTEGLKVQLNLINTDIMSILAIKSEEISSKLLSIGEATDKVAAVNFEEEFFDIKNKIEASNVAVTSLIREDIRNSNSEQLMELNQDFENLNEKLERILLKVSSDSTREIGELKSILTEKVENITSINSILGTVLDRLEQLNLSASSTDQIILESKDAVIEKINLAENSLIQSQEEVKEEILGKVAEFQSRATTNVVNKIDDVHNQTKNELYEIKENIAEVKEDLTSSAQERASEIKGEVLERINALENSLFLSQDDSKTVFLDKIDETHYESKTALYGIKDNITTFTEEFGASTQELFSEIREELFGKLSVFENTLVNTCDDSGRELSEIKEDIISGRDEFNTSVRGAITSIKSELLDKITMLEEGLLLSQDDTRGSVLSRIDSSQTETKILLGEIKDELANGAEDFNDSVRETFSDAKDELVKKIIAFEQILITSQDEVQKAVIEKISEDNISAKAELMNGIKDNISGITEDFSSSTQQILSGIKEELFEKINSLEEIFQESKDVTNTEVLESIAQTSNKTKTTILENLTQVQDDVKDFMLEKFVETNEETKTAIIDNLNKIQEEIKTSVLEKLAESNSEPSLSLENLTQMQDEIKTSIIEKINASNCETNVILENLCQSQEDIKISILEKIAKSRGESASSSDNLEQLKDEIKTSIENKIVESNEETTAILENLTQAQEEVKTSIIDKMVELGEETTDVLDNLTQTQNEIKTSIIDKITESSCETNMILDNLSQAQEEIKISILEKIAESKGESASNSENLEQLKDEIKTSIENKIIESNEETTAILENLNQSQEEIKTSIMDKITESQDEAKTAILDGIVPTQEELKIAILDKIAEVHEKTEETILKELEENILTVKKLLHSLAPDKELTEESSQKVEQLQATMQAVSSEIEDQIAIAEENHKKTTQALLSDIKLSFYEKVDDSLDGLKSFMEVFEDRTDVSQLLEDLKAEVIDRYDEVSDGLEASINSISVKGELEDLGKEIQTSVDGLFEKIQEELTTSIENNQALKDFSDKTAEIEAHIDELKTSISEDITAKLETFESTMGGQKEEFSGMLEEIKTSLSELKESYLDLSLNANMEISDVLVTLQEKMDSVQEKLENVDISEKIDGIETKLSELNFDEKFDEKIDILKNDLKDLDFSDVVSEIEEKLNKFDFNKAFEDSKSDIKNEFELINQKLDSLVSDTVSEANSGNLSEIEDDIKEIKQIIISQAALLNKVEDLQDTQSFSEMTELSDVKEEIQEGFKDFENKLDALAKSPRGENQTGNIKEELKTFKEELSENLVEFFNQISFVVEAEDIKDFVSEKTDEIKAEIKSRLSGISGGASGSVSVDGSNFNDILSSLDILHDKANTVDNNCFTIQSDIKEVKNHLQAVKSSLEEGSDYSYTLQDVESDIAKVRMILKEISEAKGAAPSASPSNLSGLDKLSDDITSLSTRTNKILLNSDESYSALKANLGDLKNVVNLFEKKVKSLDNKEQIEKIEKKVASLNSMMSSCVQSDKIFNQTFMYLAEWIDKADYNIGHIKDNMVKTTDMEKLLEKFSKKFDRQEEKIKSLEAKIEKLTKTAKPSDKEVDVKTLVKEVLAKVQLSESKPDAKLAKKVDGIDKQLATIGKSIEKITSYVD